MSELIEPTPANIYFSSVVGLIILIVLGMISFGWKYSPLTMHVVTISIGLAWWLLLSWEVITLNGWGATLAIILGSIGAWREIADLRKQKGGQIEI